MMAEESNKTDEEVKKIFDSVDQNSKLTMCMLKTGYDEQKARELIDKFDGRLREALGSIGIE